MNANTQKTNMIKTSVENYLNDCCFDVQGVGSSAISSAAESQLARILTKIAIGSATVWWSALELKDFIKLRKTIKG